MTKYLITGGAGFVGGSLAERLAQNPKNLVVIVDNLLTGSASKVPTSANCHFIKCNANNYNDLAPVMTRYGFDFVFHYAAVVGVKRTLDNPIAVLEDVQGFQSVLELCKNTGVKRVFFSSSSEVYGEPVELPQHEQRTPLNSRLPYAVVKNLGECFLRSYKQEHDLDYTIFRFFNTYGPKQSEDFVISKFMRQAMNHQDITIYGDGSQTRTFCYIDDNLDATMNALENNLFVNEVVNLGSDRIYTVLELAQHIIAATDSRSNIVHVPPLPDGDMTRRQPDVANMLTLLGRELTPLDQGLRLVVQARTAE